MEQVIAERGHNNPPDPTPIEAAREWLADLAAESELWFDGKPIENPAQTDAVAKLLDDARKAEKRFDADRKIEKAPHDEAAKAVDAAWKPLITDAKRIIEIAKATQTTWLIKLDEEKRAREIEAQRIADEKAARARKLAAEADGSLAAAKARDAALEEAKRAEQAALRAHNDKAGAKGAGMARAVTLRTTWRCEVKDRRALLNHIAKTAPQDLSDFLDEWAARAVRTGSHELPGVEAWAERAAA
jgi:colicin import membrane protein